MEKKYIFGMKELIFDNFVLSYLRENY